MRAALSRAAGVVCAAAVCAWSLGVAPCATATASVFDLFGAGASGVARPGAALATGPYAAFANPAGLGRDDGHRVVAAIAASVFALDVHIVRPLCAGDALTCQARHGGLPTRAVEPALPEPNLHLQLGFSGVVARPGGRALAAAVLLTVPRGGLVQLRGPPAEAPQFAAIAPLADRMAALAAAGWQVAPWLRLGAGVQVLAAIDSDIRAGLQPASGLMAPVEATIELSPRIRAVAGAIARLSDRAEVGLSVRQALAVAARIPTVLDTEGLLRGDMAIVQHALASPWTVDASARWQPTASVQLQVGLRAALWQWQPPPVPQVSIDIEGSAVDAVGLGQAVDIASTPAPARPYQTAWTASAGGHWRASPRWTLEAGYALRTSALPRATGSTNLLDNPAHIVGAGASLALPLPGSATAASDDGGWRLGVAVQWQHLARRAVRKADLAGDPVGDLDHGGDIVHAVVQLEVGY